MVQQRDAEKCLLSIEPASDLMSGVMDLLVYIETDEHIMICISITLKESST